MQQTPRQRTELHAAVAIVEEHNELTAEQKKQLRAAELIAQQQEEDELEEVEVTTEATAQVEPETSSQVVESPPAPAPEEGSRPIP